MLLMAYLKPVRKSFFYYFSRQIFALFHKTSINSCVPNYSFERMGSSYFNICFLQVMDNYKEIRLCLKRKIEDDYGNMSLEKHEILQFVTLCPFCIRLDMSNLRTVYPLSSQTRERQMLHYSGSEFHIQGEKYVLFIH